MAQYTEMTHITFYTLGFQTVAVKSGSNWTVLMNVAVISLMDTCSTRTDGLKPLQVALVNDVINCYVRYQLLVLATGNMGTHLYQLTFPNNVLAASASMKLRYHFAPTKSISHFEDPKSYYFCVKLRSKTLLENNCKL